MREVMTTCMWMGLVILSRPGYGLTITGQVVDSQARPVQDAEVVVCEKRPIGALDCDARMIGPVVRTDAQGIVAIQADVTSQRDVFIVARKPGTACAWDWLNSGLHTVGRKHFPLVLEPACVLAGQVVDSKGSPVAGAEVQATPVTTCGFRPVVDRWPVLGPREWFTATTDSQGRFRFEQFTKDVTASFRVRAPGWQSLYTFRTHSLISSGYEVGRSDIRLVLPWEGTIKGRVVDNRGRPMSGVELMVGPDQEKMDVTRLYIVRKVSSDLKGRFSFGGVPEGPHRVSFVVPERGPYQWTGRATDVSVKVSEVADVTVRAVKGGIVEVTALNAETRRPLAGARVHAYSRRGQQGWSAVADAAGVARVRVPEDRYTLYVSAEGFSMCHSMERVMERQIIRRQAFLAPIPGVFGRVLEPDGQPAAGAVVTVHPQGDHVYTDDQGQFAAGWSERHSDKGGFVLARDPENGLAAAVPVDDPSEPAELKLGPAWTLTGTIGDSNGVGIPAARVSVRFSVPGVLSDLGVEVLTDRKGAFEAKAIPPLLPGFGYRISVNVAGYGPREHERISPSGQAGDRVDLGTIHLPSVGATACGIVVDATGAPVAQVPVFAHGLEGLKQPGRNTITNEKGEFTITRLCPGRVRLQADFGSRAGGPGFLVTELPADGLKVVLGKELTHTPRNPASSRPVSDVP